MVKLHSLDNFSVIIFLSKLSVNSLGNSLKSSSIDFEDRTISKSKCLTQMEILSLYNQKNHEGERLQKLKELMF